MFLVYSLTTVVLATFIGKVLGKLGRRNTLSVGLIFVGVGSIMYALSDYLEPNTGFYLPMVIVARFFEGVGAACIGTSIFAIASILDEERKV